MSDTKLIARGNTADIYLESGIVRKVYHRESRSAVESEARNQEYAREAGLPVPKFMGIEVTDRGLTLSMEHLPGETMLDQIEREPLRLEEFLRKSVEWQITIHNAPAPELPPMSERLRQQIQSVLSIADIRKSELLSQIPEVGSETQLCHGDFHVQNILVNDTQLAIIDWMDATRGNPLLDVCRSYLLYLGVDASVAEMYLSEYCRQSSANPKDVTRWLPLLAAARLSEHVSPAEEDRLMTLVLVG